ncbi:Legume lectin domain containing protein [Trema orientale]|uniref:Legume lectin domain containing protein n=1 Tax=Trema orientale TaxID=63057 RepID=A0A2P5F7F5_TREOI|nr:Legume lectin domain containing protein [Trema orientale]
MAVTNLSIITPTFHHKKLIAFLLVLIYLFLLLPNLQCSISFNRTDFADWPEIKLYGNTSVINGTFAILNTDPKKKTRGTGRAVFGEEFNLWGPLTRKIADFDTRFSFSMLSGDATVMGDGFAFFLANNGTLVGASGGGCLGLIPNCGGNTMESGLVAVEFDNF